jgi:hypothetical protein
MPRLRQCEQGNWRSHLITNPSVKANGWFDTRRTHFHFILRHSEQLNTFLRSPRTGLSRSLGGMIWS